MDFIESFEQKIQKLAEQLVTKQNEIASLWDKNRRLQIEIEKKDEQMRVMSRRQSEIEEQKDHLIETVEKLLSQNE